MRTAGFLSAVLLLCSFAQAQPWTYDFGTVAATFTSGASSGFLPPPPSGSARVRIGSQGGAVELRNPGDTRLGAGCEAALVAPTGGSLNKLQWHGFAGGSGFTLRLQMVITGGAGDVYFFCGSGSCFSDNGGFTSAQVFTGLRWNRSAGGLDFAFRDGGGWTPCAASPMLADSVFLLELYANNSSNGITYVHGSSQTLPAHSWDLWVDGQLLLDDCAGAGLPDTSDIDAFMFYGAGSPANDCTLLLDDLQWTNIVALQPLPVELTHFELRADGQRAYLRWRTESEIQNFGFEILRRLAGADWETRGFMPGDGCRNTPRWYAFADAIDGLGGSVRYRLRQLDRDGGSCLSEERTLHLSADEEMELGYPRLPGGRSELCVPVRVGRERTLTLELLSITGSQAAVLPAERLLPAGWQDLRLRLSGPCHGPHLLVLRSEQNVLSRVILL